MPAGVPPPDDGVVLRTTLVARCEQRWVCLSLRVRARSNGRKRGEGRAMPCHAIVSTPRATDFKIKLDPLEIRTLRRTPRRATEFRPDWPRKLSVVPRRYLLDGPSIRGAVRGRSAYPGTPRKVYQDTCRVYY